MRKKSRIRLEVQSAKRNLKEEEEGKMDSVSGFWMEISQIVFRGALHKIGRFRNVPTIGTFVNKLKIKFINKRTYGRYVSETTYFM